MNAPALLNLAHPSPAVKARDSIYKGMNGGHDRVAMRYAMAVRVGVHRRLRFPLVGGVEGPFRRGLGAPSTTKSLLLGLLRWGM